jgi:hypothetical protein
MYLGGAAPKPFSALVKKNDALPLDFPSDHYGFEFDDATFVFADMPNFHLHIK